jgi:aquaporin Z
VLLSGAPLGSALAHLAVSHAATLPGPAGIPVASAAEVVISFLLMLVVLRASSHADRRRARMTGLCAGVLVATWIAVEAPPPERPPLHPLWCRHAPARSGS